MSKRALAERRPFLLASVLAALSFYYLRGGPYPDLLLIPLKGSAVGLLGIYAWMRHSSQDSRLLAIMLFVAALGDMAAEFYLAAGVVLYFGQHVIALMLYFRHKRAQFARNDKLIVAALLLATPLLAWLLPTAPEMKEPAALYALSLGGMAAAAWGSTFPRLRVGAGALLFVAAHLLAIAGLGPLAQSEVPQIFAWPVYYLGQLLIATGVTLTLRKRDPELKLVSSR